MVTANSTGYGPEHQRLREQALALFVDGTPCPICGRKMHAWQAQEVPLW